MSDTPAAKAARQLEAESGRLNLPALLQQAERSRTPSTRDLAAVTRLLLDLLESTLWQARRYADGRQSYAPGELNRAVSALLALGVPVAVDPAYGTRWARTGDQWPAEALSDPEHTPKEAQ